MSYLHHHHFSCGKYFDKQFLKMLRVIGLTNTSDAPHRIAFSLSALNA